MPQSDRQLVERSPGRPHVVIVGGGFAGLNAAKKLRRAAADVTVIDRSNHHLFQPLLYQVAMAGLSPADIATPIRSILRKQANARVILGDVTGFDIEGQRVLLREGTIAYDYLVVAAGAETSYFGHDDWEHWAPGLKVIADALEVRRRVLAAFEEAEREPDPARREQLMTFVVIGGGPTGVELAGALAELSRTVLSSDFRRIDPQKARIVLVEMAPRILPPFPPELSASAFSVLRRLGVEVRTSTRVSDIDGEGVHLDGDEIVRTKTVLWGAGVKPASLGRALSAPLDRRGYVLVEPDLSIPGHPEVFVVGDLAAFVHQGGEPLPGLAPVASQQGRHVGRMIRRLVAGGTERPPFRYVDKGMMATVGRKSAVASIKSLNLHGFFAWLAWLFVHIIYLIGFRNRISVLINWFYSYVTYRRGARLITEGRMEAGAPARKPLTPAPTEAAEGEALRRPRAPGPAEAPGDAPVSGSPE